MYGNNLKSQKNQTMEIKMEKWRDIPGYEGLYQASDLGKIKSLEKYVNNRYKDVYREERILKPSISKGGYKRVVLTKDGTKKYIAVHRLIAMTFIPNPDNFPQINHKDEDKQNNCVSNLEWCTCKYNTRYSKAKKIIQYDLEGNYIKEWDCIKQVEEELNIKSNNLGNCLKGRNKTAGGYIWRYINENN